MSADRNISDEHLNAFVDGQLDADEKSRILGAINADEELSRRACEFRRLRELVAHAYDNPPPPPRSRRLGSRTSGWRQGIAAALLLAIGGGAGWVAGHAQQQSALSLRAMYLDEEKAFQTSDLAQAPVRGSRKIILHISSDAPDKLDHALTTAEQLLATYSQLRQPLELELVANAGGLNLLRADTSPYAERVRELQRQYDNLTFLACQTAMDRLRREKNVSPGLLPEALVTPNALDEILTRLQQGWMYISV